jgi:hypothetical protein
MERQMAERKLEIETFCDEDDELLLRLSEGEIVETEEPGGCWYHLTPAEELIDLFARFAQRLLWRREGKPDAAITDMHIVSDKARSMAECFLRKVCRKLMGDTYGGDDGFNMSFVESIEVWMVDLQYWIENDGK